MHYVYLLRSLKNPSETYIGYTIDLTQRLAAHNSGGTYSTRDNKPWELVAYIALDTKAKALAFEKYLKVGSGNAFAKKRLW